MYNVYVETYGCSANQNNSEIIKGLLTRAGFCTVSSEKNADIVIINTCIVKGITLQKMFSRIEEAAASRKVIVAGCLADVPAQVSKIRKVNDKISFVGSHHIKEIGKVAADLILGKQN